MTPSLPLRHSLAVGLVLLSSCAAGHPANLRFGQNGPTDTAVNASAEQAVPPPEGASAASGAFLAGRLAGQHGDLDLAASAFLRALAADPGNQEIAQQAFLTCLLAGRPEVAALAARQADNPAAILVLGDIDARAGRWDRAAERFAKLPRQGATQVLQPLLTAWAQYGGGHPDVALATLQPYIADDRSRGVFALHAALIADLSQRVPEARRLYAVARANYPTINLDLAREVASFDARDGQPDAARQLLAQMSAQSSEVSLALPALQRDAAAPQVRDAMDGMAETYLALAATLRAQDSTEYAAILLRLALDMRPDFTAARLLSAEVQAQAGRPDAALALLNGVKADDPLSPLVDVRRADLLRANDRLDEALKVAAGLVAKVPDRAEPYALQGTLLRAAKRPADAALAYDQAVARIGTPTRDNWPLFYDRGIAHDQADQWQAAQADFERALQLAPDQPEVLNYLAYAWTERGEDLARARAMVQRAVARDPNDGAFVDSLGWVALRQGDVIEAVKQLERASELMPEDPTINGHLGDAYQAAGRLREAAFQWQRALTLKPEPKDAAHYQAGLKSLPASAAP